MKTTKSKTSSSELVGARTSPALAVLSLALVLAGAASAQLVLTGTNYTQNFNAIGSGLPAGWSVRTNAGSTNPGSSAIFVSAAKSWGDSGGEFGNCASLTNNAGVVASGSESSAAQAAFTNRVLGVRQTSSFGDPGAAFVLQIKDTAGLSNIVFTVDLNMLKVNGCSTIWTLDYAVGTTPTSFTTLDTYHDPCAFGATRASFSLGTDAHNQSQNVWIRIVALTGATGSGSRDTFGIDNFALSFDGPSAPSITVQPASRTNAVLTTANLCVEALGIPPFHYQWYKGNRLLADGGGISGATNETLTLSQVLHADADSYTVVITNAYGSVTSSIARLTVVGFAIAPLDPTHTVAGAPVSVGLNFIDNQTPVMTASGNSGNQDILPNGNISASISGNSGSATLTPLVGANGVVLVSLMASDGSFSTNTVFPLMVRPSGAVVFNDHFDYANGPVTSASLGMWRHHAGPTGEILTTNGELRVSRSLDEDVHALLVGQPYNPSGATVLYSRFRVRFTDLPTSSGNYLAHFLDASGSSHRGRLWASTANAAAGKFRLGIGNSSSSTATTAQFPLDLELNSAFLVVTRLVLSNGLATLWINPAAETNASVTAADIVTSLVNIASYTFRQDSSEGNLLVDDFVVATSFESALGAGPPMSIPLSISVRGKDVVLDWSNPAFALAWATNLSGPYTRIPGATCPCTNATTGSKVLYRLVWP